MAAASTIFSAGEIMHNVRRAPPPGSAPSEATPTPRPDAALKLLSPPAAPPAAPAEDPAAYLACPELSALVELMGDAEAADGVALLLIEATLKDIAELDACLDSCDLDRAALCLHRIVGGYHVLGPSPLMEEGRALLNEMRTLRKAATLARLSRFRGRLLALTWRLEAAMKGGGARTADARDQVSATAPNPNARLNSER